VSDVTAAIVFHGEGLLAAASITSFTRCCDKATTNGIEVTRLALLDRADGLTRKVVEAEGAAFDRVESVDHGDLGATRNSAVDLMSSTYAAFFDGDDLWGDQWLVRAHQYAEAAPDGDVIFHPRFVYRFSPADYRIQSRTAIPPVGAISHVYVQLDSREASFDPRSLLFCNPWSANAFAKRSVYERYPYHRLDRTTGFGFEDWTWNLETLVHGVTHAIVPETVHCIRTNRQESLGRQQQAEGIIPPIHRFASQLERAWETKRAALSLP
jgi:hypothetical protein